MASFHATDKESLHKLAGTTTAYKLFTGYIIQGIQDTKDIRSQNHSTTVILENSYGEGIRHEPYIKYMPKVVSPNILGAQSGIQDTNDLDILIDVI